MKYPLLFLTDWGDARANPANPILIQELNQLLRGWVNYFRFGYPSDVST
jgi:hypothetical protein